MSKIPLKSKCIWSGLSKNNNRFHFLQIFTFIVISREKFLWKNFFYFSIWEKETLIPNIFINQCINRFIYLLKSFFFCHIEITSNSRYPFHENPNGNISVFANKSFYQPDKCDSIQVLAVTIVCCNVISYFHFLILSFTIVKTEF